MVENTTKVIYLIIGNSAGGIGATEPTLRRLNTPLQQRSVTTAEVESIKC
ncbi:hypothetical protein ACFLTK_00030 [Chloroflexota bacterium]